MKSSRNRAVSGIMVLAMTISLTPINSMSASAETVLEPSMVAGTNIIADGEYVYFGKTASPDDSRLYSFADDETGQEIKWKVLDSDKTNTDEDGMFLISDALFGDGTGRNGDITFGRNNTWADSNVQNWCSIFLNNNLSSVEQAAILSVTKLDPFGAYGNLSMGESSLNNEKIFFLSGEEAVSTVYFADNDARKANFGSSAGYWWLRSPYAYDNVDAAVVLSDGVIHDFTVDYICAARPAFNLDLDSVLFSSAIENGKADMEGDNKLTAVGKSSYTENGIDGEYKLTIKDNTRSGFSIGTVTKNETTLSIAYSSAMTGINEYISAVVEDSTDTIKYYGRLANLTETTAASGSVDVALPTMGEGDKLYIFNEQYNEGCFTDYASELKEVEIPADVSTEATTTTTTTVTETTTKTSVIEQITDIDRIREMLTEYITENELDAKIVSNKEYPDYQPIVIEYNSEKAANIAILKYAEESNIDMSNVGFVPIVDGVAITTVNPDSATTTTTTTTTTVPDNDDSSTTSTAVYDYATFLEYDSSPMKVGETRTVRFYNPQLDTMTKMNAYEVSENISYSYEEGSDILTITALAAGKARIYIMGEGCAFGCYLNIEVVDDSSTTTNDTESTTTTTTSTNDGSEGLPQTGYSNIYKVIAGLAVLMTAIGAALVVKTRKETE